MKLEESDSVSSDLKRQLQEQAQVLQSDNDVQKQLQATIDDLTRRVDSLKQGLQVLCEPPKFVSSFHVPAETVGSLTYLTVSRTSDVGHTVTLSEDCSTAIIRISFKG